MTSFTSRLGLPPQWCDPNELSKLESSLGAHYPAIIPFDLADDVGQSLYERASLLNPFATLIRIEHCGVVESPRVLIVSAMSGQHAVFLRDLAAGLCQAGFDLAIIDWCNARDVPACLGSFEFDDVIATVLQALARDKRPTHIVGVCQACVPVVIAASVAKMIGEPSVSPASLCLLGGPIDAGAAQTNLSLSLAAIPIEILEFTAIENVGTQFEGRGRRIYPASTQKQQLQKYLNGHKLKGGPVKRKLEYDDGLNPTDYPFEALLTTLKDLPATAFLESIDIIYHRRDLVSNTTHWRAGPVPIAQQSLPLFTAEAEYDDIVAPGQTSAAHRMMPTIRAQDRAQLRVDGGSHFDLFHGQLCRGTVVPALKAFIDLHQS